MKRFRLGILLYSMSIFLWVGCAGPRLAPRTAKQQPKRGFFDRFSKAPLPPEQELRLARYSGVKKGGGFGKFRWPLQKVQLTSFFGGRWGTRHEGIDLRAKTGTPVYSAQAGVVLYADSKIGGYGKMIVVRHADSLATIYAHNSRLLVKRGQIVRPSQMIAYSGNTGRSSGPHLHFEVRRGSDAVDPLHYLPTRGRKRPSLARGEPLVGARVASLP